MTSDGFWRRPPNPRPEDVPVDPLRRRTITDSSRVSNTNKNAICGRGAAQIKCVGEEVGAGCRCRYLVQIGPVEEGLKTLTTIEASICATHGVRLNTRPNILAAWRSCVARVFELSAERQWYAAHLTRVRSFVRSKRRKCNPTSYTDDPWTRFLGRNKAEARARSRCDRAGGRGGGRRPAGAQPDSVGLNVGYDVRVWWCVVLGCGGGASGLSGMSVGAPVWSGCVGA